MHNRNKSLLFFFLCGVVFLARETIIWVLGKLLDLLPLKKLPDGSTDMAALPWLDIVGVSLLTAGVALWLADRFGLFGPVEEPTRRGSFVEIAELQDALKAFRGDVIATLAHVRSDVDARISEALSALEVATESAKAAVEITDRTALVEEMKAEVNRLTNYHLDTFSNMMNNVSQRLDGWETNSQTLQAQIWEIQKIQENQAEIIAELLQQMKPSHIGPEVPSESCPGGSKSPS